MATNKVQSKMGTTFSVNLLDSTSDGATFLVSVRSNVLILLKTAVTKKESANVQTLDVSKTSPPSTLTEEK